ncbi:MAG: putative sugar nucleotidyl transferase [Planctomycetota bacterium]|nr:putative sugar nucleotidyl transferase [Planctomycetota bacterium]MDA1213086.1 putative sugar nucleotidyl transferase [Planctomycetota bacterium]
MFRVGFFEDDKSHQLAPLSLLRPVFELVCGSSSLRERLIRQLGIDEWSVFVREHLVDTYHEEYPDVPINDFLGDRRTPLLLLNGRWLPTASDIHHLRNLDVEEAGVIDDTLVYLTLDPQDAQILIQDGNEDLLWSVVRSRKARRALGRIIEYPWDLIDANPAQLLIDFRIRQAMPKQIEIPQHVTVLGSPDQVWISPTADIEPFVVIDARHGPVSIDDEAIVQSFTRIEGPSHIGRAARIFRANIRSGTTIGPYCRVGGEVEATILHAYVNKYHDGFLGHSYVCPWVNLGALSTNSDLKTDYSTVKVPLQGELIETGLKKVGCYIGDHTKTGLGSLFNTGSSIGVMCMILPNGGLLPKHIPSFGRIWRGELDDSLNFPAALHAAATAMLRRDQILTDAQRRLLHYVYQQSQSERHLALNRQQSKQSSLPIENRSKR